MPIERFLATVPHQMLRHEPGEPGQAFVYVCRALRVHKRGGGKTYVNLP